MTLSTNNYECKAIEQGANICQHPQNTKEFGRVDQVFSKQQATKFNQYSINVYNS